MHTYRYTLYIYIYILYLYIYLTIKLKINYNVQSLPQEKGGTFNKISIFLRRNTDTRVQTQTHY